MRFACTMAAGRGDTDMVLFSLAKALSRQCVKTVGTVQINSAGDCDGPCDMDVRILPNGPDIRISQSLGKHAKGCRLDPEALEIAVQNVAARLERGADCLIVNKFGKHEANGRGFRDVIAQAISRNIPVLVGLNALNERSFRAFVGADCTTLPPDLNSLKNWITSQVGIPPVAAPAGIADFDIPAA